MNNPNFQKLYDALNTVQKQAVDTIEGPVMVIAGPGTGKTQILTLRIANILLQTQINPANILALTFTESAAAEMRERLAGIIGSDAYRVPITTFHSFSNDNIKKYPEYFTHLIASNHVTELEQIQLIETIIEETALSLLKPLGDTSFYVLPALHAINDLKKEGITPVAFRDAVEKSEKDFENIADLYYDKGAYTGKMKGKYIDLQKHIAKNKELIKIYTLYQERLQEKKLYDFNDMLLEMIHALKTHPDFLLQLQETYQYILVDEHQDTNAAQNTILELLANYFENPNLFVVGDHKQAIFRFQGASLENFLYFKKLYPAAILLELTDNYRSTQLILNSATSVITKNTTTIEFIKNQTLIAQKNHPDQKITIAPFTTQLGELSFITEQIRTQIAKGLTPSEIAVLGRNNKDLLPLLPFFDREQIPYTLESDENILDDKYIAQLLLILRMIHTLTDADSIKAMHIESFGIDEFDIYKLIISANEQKTTIKDILEDPEKLKELQLHNAIALSNFCELLKAWKKISENEPLDSLFVQVLNQSNLLQSILAKENSIYTLDKMTRLFDDLQQKMERETPYTLSQYLGYIDLLATHNLTLKTTRPQIKTNAVRLMTAHRSKGLEFDSVFLIYGTENRWGIGSKKGQLFALPWEYLTEKLSPVSSEDLLDDERRLFYVALTRARKEICITYAKTNLEGRVQLPSQFLQELDQELTEEIDTTTFEETVLAHKEKLFLLPEKNPEKKQDVLQKNIQIFARIFAQKGLSPTALNNYLSCPWKYFFRNLLEVPEVKTESMLFGTAIHKALNLSIITKSKSLQFLLDAFTKEVQDLHLPEVMQNKLIEQGRQELTGFYEDVVKTWPNNLQSELIVRGVKLDDGTIIKGRIDMIEPTGKQHDVIVHDFKTGKPKSRNYLEKEGEEGNYKRQLVFYNLLLNKFNNGSYHMTQGALDFIQPLPSGTHKIEYFAITKEELEALETLIKETAREISTLSFWNQTCDDRDCEYCRLRSFMHS